jgi:hypothetical protein
MSYLSKIYCYILIFTIFPSRCIYFKYCYYCSGNKIDQLLTEPSFFYYATTPLLKNFEHHDDEGTMAFRTGHQQQQILNTWIS